MANYESQHIGNDIDTAVSTYLSKSEASSTYLTQANAASTYATQANLTITNNNLNAVDARVAVIEGATIIDMFDATGTVHGTGNNMTWHCIKWSNGVSMCHGIATSTRSSAGAGNIFYASGSDPYWDFPTDLFISTPTLSISIQTTSGANWLWPGTGNATSNTRTCNIMPFYYQSYSNLTVTFGLMAWGFWK